MPSLVIYGPDGTRKTTVEVTDRPLKIGRADTCDIVLRDDAEVSREHAEITLDELGRVVVTDKGSKNGTRVDDGVVFRDGQRIASRSLRVGEHVIHVLGAASPATVPESRVMFTPDEPAQVADTQFFPSTRGLDLNQQRLALLMQLTERIGGVFERKQLLEQALDACCEALGFERVLIALKTQRGDTELPVTRNVERDETGAFKVSRTLINRALLEGERAIVNNPATDLAGNLSDSLVRFPICSALCVPILYRNEILGVIYGDRITQASTYQPEDVDFLAAIAQQVGNGLANLRLFQEHVRSQRVYAELEQARLIQRRLLPPAPLRLGRITIEGHNEASSAVSGDYFDYFDLENGRVGLIIADVTGHGLPAALMMANLQAAIRVALSADIALPELATRINKLICRNTASHVFITAILGTVDSQTGLVEYVGAGHPFPVLLGGGAVRIPEDKNSLPLGINPGESYEVMRIDPADQVAAALFYTDGLVEATAQNGQMLGLEPIITALSSLNELLPATIVRTARDVVRQHLGELANMDDMTLLAVQVR
ncbi:MAG: SpoIIE family protein phosphatase [Phycisphaerae bacterium]